MKGVKRFKLALKAAMIPSIIGLIAVVVGVILLIIGGAVTNNDLAIAGGVVALIGLGCFYFAYLSGKQTLNAICPECEKFMGDSDKSVNYTYVCEQYKENYNSSTHEFKGYTFFYTCTITCPHCGNTSTFEHKVDAKTQPEANVKVDRYLKATLKITK